MGRQAQALRGNAGTYRFSVKPRQIVTLRFSTGRIVAVPPAIRAWDAVVPPGGISRPLTMSWR
jgi:hypothetical protein